MRSRILKSMLAGGVCALALGTAAMAQAKDFNVPAGDLAPALDAYIQQSGEQLVYRVADARGVVTGGVHGALSSEEALAQILAGTNLRVQRDPSGLIAVASAERQDPQSGSAGGGAEGNAVDALIVTAQKREENIQDVPIAISAFSQKALEEQKIEGGFDLLKAIPNVTFSKSNFSSYNFSIRGVGTKAISATTDPGVSVAFNSTGLIQNRLFEQEYFDVERVEVLRGPQGTLYGRNATSGVINVISAKPDLGEFDGWIKGEVGNYETKRLSAMVNVPLIEDKLAIRLAGALTSRQGYDFNSVTDHPVNGRDLWSARVTIGFEPTERLRGNFIWERFDEDDDRSRTGKQLCHRDPGVQMIGATPTVVDPNNNFNVQMTPAMFSQGCMPGNLYDDAAFGTPNGLALPFIFGMLALQGDCGVGCGAIWPLGNDEVTRHEATLIKVQDPYGGMMQSRDLRTIASFKDPIYRAKADVFELNVDFDLTESLTLSSQTAYNKDEVYSFQDFNRFNTVPIFTDTLKLTNGPNSTEPSLWRDLAPNGVFCDPQLGCSDTMAGFDISQAVGKQFSQELRLQSSFDGPVNFSVGANYTKFETLIDYYVMYNIITGLALTQPFYLPIDDEFPNDYPRADHAEIDISRCFFSGYLNQLFYLTNGTVPAGDPTAGCPYIDPNPVESINGDGHNYFRSKNPYKLKSWAAFGELYWNVNDTVNVTAGLRYTDDKKTFIPVPSQILLAPDIMAGGNVSRGYEEKPAIVQNWGEWTGRLAVDWKPDLSFTDATMVYASYSHGYKGGGANPPTPGFQTLEEAIAMLHAQNVDQSLIDLLVDFKAIPVLTLNSVEYGPTFDPEFVDAFEIGAKNTLLDGTLTLNLGGFFYDYKDYQVSQIRDRTAINENFDATVWGLELESVFAPSRNLRILANVGYLDTRIADGESSIDIMNRTQSDPGYIIVKPWVQLPSNCVVPVQVAEQWLKDRPPGIPGSVGGYWTLCGGLGGVLGAFGLPPPIDTGFGDGTQPYDFRNYPQLNGGAGLEADLGGNELPNAPHWTANIGAQYGLDFGEGWRATVRSDVYWQSQSWHRVYNADPYDKLHGWYNVNLSVWIERPDDGLKIELYAKNILDKTPITDAFLNSDDTALTTNVFVLDPRLIGLSIRKEF